MNNFPLISDICAQLNVTMRRIKYLTELLTEDDGQGLNDIAVSDLHFWIDELVDHASRLVESAEDAIQNAQGEAQ